MAGPNESSDRRLYRRSAGSESWDRGADVTGTAWQAAARARGVSIEDVIHPRARFVAWLDNGAALELEVSGRLPDGSEIRASHVERLDRSAGRDD